MRTNYEWKPFMNQKYLGYVKNSVRDSNLSFQAFKTHIEKAVNIDLIPIKSNNGSPYMETAASSSNYDEKNYTAWRAFDGDDVSEPWSRWISSRTTASFTPAWLSYDIGQPTINNPGIEYSPVYVRSYYILPELGSCKDRAPKSWVLQGWNGSTWIAIDSRSNMSVFAAPGSGWVSTSGALEGKTFVVATPKPFKKYRLLINQVNGSNVTSIRQLKLFY
jgi:hypothetical protein